MGRRFDDDGWLGPLLGIVGGIGLIAATAAILGNDDKRRQKEQEYIRRKTTPITKPYWFRNEMFKSIVRSSIDESRRKQRLSKIRINMPCVILTVKSQSGLSEWQCEIDFNDYGRINGKYWIKTENDDSELPEKIASIISRNIIAYINDPSNIPEWIYSNNDKTSSEGKNHGKAGKKGVSKLKRVIGTMVLLTIISSMIFAVINPLKTADIIDAVNMRVGDFIVNFDASSLSTFLYDTKEKLYQLTYELWR